MREREEKYIKNLKNEITKLGRERKCVKDKKETKKTCREKDPSAEVLSKVAKKAESKA